MADERTTDPAQTPNEILQDRSIRHLVYLLRLQNREANWIVETLERETIPDLLDTLESRLRRIEERGYDLGPVTTQRLAALLTGLDEIVTGWSARTFQSLTERMEALAAQEAEWQQGVLNSVVAVETTLPATTLLSQAILERPFDGSPLEEWFTRLETDTKRRLESAIRQGLVQGETVQQIVQRVRGTRAMSFRDGVLGITTRQAEAVVRSAVIHASTQARLVFFEQQADLLKGLQWVSTLDSRTCPTCGALDGRVFPLDKGSRPPAHVNCRCTLTPVLKQRLPLAPGERASSTGPVPDTLTFPQWLRKQPRDIVEDMLGVTRADLFLKGRLKITDFVNRRGELYTLEQLRKKDGLTG